MLKRARRGWSGSAGGFSVVEMLVVIGIIGILVGLLAPAINHIRSRAKAAKAASVVQVLRAGCEAYHQTFNAYPGPYRNDQCLGNPATGPENLVLGLIGGLQVDGSGTVTFNRDLVGLGPRSLNVANPKTYAPFIENWSQMLISADKVNELNAGRAIPVFVERSYTERPILYLRARPGAPGIVDTAGAAQYDLRMITLYTTAAFNADPFNSKHRGRVGLSGDKGLALVGDVNGPLLTDGTPNDAGPYLRNPSLPTVPRARDGFILIAAGPDGLYGTADDITSFGSVVP